MKRALPLLLLLTFSATIQAQKPTAALPQATVDTTWSQLAGKTWACHTAADFTAALKASTPGDLIVLDAGAVFTGNFVIPAKAQATSGTAKWIYIESSAQAKLPAAGTRVGPPDAPNMPKIVSPNVSQALAFASGANHVRLVGLEIYSASSYAPTGYTAGVKYGYYLVGLSGGWPPVQPIPDFIIFDRVYVHGDSTHDIQAGLQINFSNVAVVDSYVADIHMRGTDTCAACAFFTPGPILLRNNYLEAAGENVIFGGSGQNYNPWVPSDITITGNYLFKPLAWVPLSLPPISQYVVKNSLELKSAKRVLVDSNTIENKWAAGQVTGAVLLTVRTSQSGDLAVVQDITITNNVIKNVISGFSTLTKDDQCGIAPYTNCHNAGDVARLNISNNLVSLWDTTAPGGGGHTDLITFSPGEDRINGGIAGVAHDIVVQHNTVVPYPGQSCWAGVYFNVAGVPPTNIPPPWPSSITTNVWIQDNVLCRQTSGTWGLQGMKALNAYMSAPSAAPNDLPKRYAGNVMFAPAGEIVQTWPPSNDATVTPLALDANYVLTSPAWTQTSDAKLAGVDPTKFGLAPPMLTPAQLAQIATDQALIDSDSTALQNAQDALTTVNTQLTQDQANLAAYLTTLCQSTDGHTYQAQQSNGAWVCVLIK